MREQVDQILADIDNAAQYRTRFEGQTPRRDEVLAAEIRRLREIVRQLPVTADGVPVFPDMIVWNTANPSSSQVVDFVVAPYSEWKTDVWGTPNQPRAVRYGGRGGWPARRCYSTREAAEAAKGGRDAE